MNFVSCHYNLDVLQEAVAMPTTSAEVMEEPVVIGIMMITRLKILVAASTRVSVVVWDEEAAEDLCVNPVASEVVLAHIMQVNKLKSF